MYWTLWGLEDMVLEAKAGQPGMLVEERVSSHWLRRWRLAEAAVRLWLRARRE